MFHGLGTAVLLRKWHHNSIKCTVSPGQSFPALPTPEFARSTLQPKKETIGASYFCHSDQSGSAIWVGQTDPDCMSSIEHFANNPVTHVQIHSNSSERDWHFFNEQLAFQAIILFLLSTHAAETPNWRRKYIMQTKTTTVTSVKCGWWCQSMAILNSWCLFEFQSTTKIHFMLCTLKMMCHNTVEFHTYFINAWLGMSSSATTENRL